MFADQRVEFAVLGERVSANDRHIHKNSGAITMMSQSIEKDFKDISVRISKINNKSKLDWGDMQKKIFVAAVMAGLLFVTSPAKYLAHLLKH